MSIPDLSLRGKVAIVTGAKRGMGKAIALGLAEAGADVAVCSRVEDGGLKTVAEEIRKLGRRSLVVQADISRKAEVEAMVQQVMAEFGVIDILVNNAAIGIRSPMLEVTEENWDKEINTNLKGYFLCSQAVAKHMVAQKKGNIINMASQLSFKAMSPLGVYCISKAGVAMLTRVMARELGPYNVRVNAIAPAMVKTEFNRRTWSNPELMQKIDAAVPLGGRVGLPEDVVGTALFLASDASSYITGHYILVDGGTNA
ncbi:MAG: glucose 1-dehydrogenase [Chloroflexota bacterium]|nr:glucose 1-dehydrogenase [Chloroflexota bacterium]